MKAKCCPRCLTISGDPEDGHIHTCTPSKAWREMEARVAELETALQGVYDTPKGYQDVCWNLAADALHKPRPK